MRLGLFIAVIAIAAGCTRSTESQSKPEKESTLRTAINGATGKTAVDAGKQARNRIEAISKKHDEQLNEVLGE